MQVLLYPNDILRHRSIDLAQPEIMSPKWFGTAMEMVRIMMASKGIGMAAPQVGILKRIIVLMVPEYKGVMMNPTIVETHQNQIRTTEGCLSFPGMAVEVSRPETVTVEFNVPMNLVRQKKTFTGISARCVLHEMDHLNGVLMIDLGQEVKQGEDNDRATAKN